MSDLARIEIDRDVAEAAARRAAEEGLSLTAYVSLLLRRSFERSPGQDSILVYDHVEEGDDCQINRDPDEDDQSYARRLQLYDSLFNRRG